MKRTFKRPDGTEETLEGSPEELADYESFQRQVPKVDPEPKKPEVLKGSPEQAPYDADSLQKMLEEWLKQQPPPAPAPSWPQLAGPIWIVSCPTCGRVGCQGNCVLNPYPWFTITCTTNSDKALIAPAQTDTYVDLTVTGFSNWQEIDSTGF